MVMAIGCLVTASVSLLKQVRVMRAPALVEAFGDWKWWAPRRLLRLLSA